MDKFLQRTLSGKRLAMGFALAVVAAQASAAQAPEILGPQILGPRILGDVAACRAGSTAPAALVHVHGFKDNVGGLRLQLYSDVPADFLVSGRKLSRIDLPMVTSTPMTVCMALPKPGRYALAVLHDRVGDHKFNLFHDGAGFSNNPKLGFGKPELAAVLFKVENGVTPLDVVLNYRVGFALRPLPGRD